MGNPLKSKPLLRVHCWQYNFTPKILPTLATLAILPILLSLGAWQLERADYKQEQFARFQHLAHTRPIGLKQILQHDNWKQLRYRPVKLSGHYDSQHTLLLDNQINAHRAGYQVITPFYPTGDHRAVLVYRGWIPRGRTRHQLPSIAPIPPALGSLTGFLEVPSRNFKLNNRSRHAHSWPRLLQTVEIDQIATMLHSSLFPFTIKLDQKANHGFKRNWKPVTHTASKHLGYAVQWFALALTLMIIFIVVNTHKDDHGQPRNKQ